MWTPYQPTAQQPWKRSSAAHLFRRAGFGANWAELERALADGPAKTIDRLLRPAADVTAFNREQDACEVSGTSALPVPELRGWWLRRMLTTPHPLLEKMTLFWHGYFGVGHSRVNNSGLMLDHIRTLRTHALGRFDALLAALVCDPAVLLAAGGAANPKARPNEYFARQLLARYTVGDGQFTDRDVTDVARAFTGCHVRGGKWRNVPYDHDTGSKTIFGQTGPWTPVDFVRLAVKQPALSRRLVRTLYRLFITEEQEPSDEVIEPLVRDFAKDLDIGNLVAMMLRSTVFFSLPVRRQRVKSPVELAVGFCRALEAMVPTLTLGADLAELGQNLYQPPTLKGWFGGRRWINHATIIGRTKLIDALLAATGRYEKRIDPAAIARKHGRADTQGFLADLFDVRDLTYPEFQLA